MNEEPESLEKALVYMQLGYRDFHVHGKKFFPLPDDWKQGFYNDGYEMASRGQTTAVITIATEKDIKYHRITLP